MRTTWNFDSPAAPHFGGLWEAVVNSTKLYLKRVLGEHVLTFIELRTLTCTIENCINSRPLAYILKNDSDFEILTPALFFDSKAF